jgi:hypothetical protein
MDIADLLRWAAGAPVRLDCPENVTDERLLPLLGIDLGDLTDLLHAHRLVQRFLHRAHGEQPSWCPCSLLAGLARADQQLQALHQRQLQAVRELTAALGNSAQPPILIKGFSTYALSGDRRALRFSEDLDVVCPEPEHAWQTLRRLGYAGEEIGHHEYAKVWRDEITIEIHQSFPICAYPEPVSVGDAFVPAEHAGCWLQPAASPILFDNTDHEPIHRHRHHHGLRYPDLLACSTHGVTMDTADVVVPDATMAAFLNCAHQFRHFVEPPFRRPVPIRLATVSEVRELLHHPQFHKARFARLVEKFGAQDAVDFTLYLVREYFGEEPLPTSRPRTRDQRSWWPFSSPRSRSRSAEPICPFPRSLCFDGGWASFYHPDELLIFLPRGAAVTRLGANQITARPEAPAATSAVPAECPGQSPERVIVQYHQERELPFTVAATWGWQGLSLAVRLRRRLPADGYYHVGVHGDQYSELCQWVNISPTGAVLETGTGVPSLLLLAAQRAAVQVAPSATVGAEHVSVAPLPEGYDCRISFPRTTLPGSLRRSPTKPVVLRLMQVRRPSAAGPAVIDPVVVAPLLIQVES